MRRITLWLGITALAVAVAAPPSPAASPGRPSAVQWRQRMLRIQRQYGYLPLHGPSAEARAAKAALDRARRAHPERFAPTAAGPMGTEAHSPTTSPTLSSGWLGLAQSNVAPPDPTGAAGPKSYLEAVNLQLGLFSRSGSRIASDRFYDVTNTNDSLSDPEVLWDVQTQRFYFLIWDVDTGTMRWGFSKTSDPRRIPKDFCVYDTDLGWNPPALPDYPKLGQTNDFLLVGANVYQPPNEVTFRGADLGWITKPKGSSSIRKCPSGRSFKSGHVENLQDCESASLVANLEPAKQVDPSSTGWVVANPDPTNNGAPADHLDLFKITRGPGGVPSIPVRGTCVPIPPYIAPPSPALQEGSPTLIDTLDGRLTNAISAYDPLRKGTGLWTQHTVFDGAGAAVRWYEVDVASSKLFQHGEVASPEEFIYNGGVAPDRVIPKATGKRYFGSNMVLGFTASSPLELPTAKMVSKIGDGPQSRMVTVRVSAGPDAGFDCFQSIPIMPLRCRWGDYAGAAPDPSSSTKGREGRVFLSNQLSTGVIDPLFTAGWATWNWLATP